MVRATCYACQIDGRRVPVGHTPTTALGEMANQVTGQANYSFLTTSLSDARGGGILALLVKTDGAPKAGKYPAFVDPRCGRMGRSPAGLYPIRAQRGGDFSIADSRGRIGLSKYAPRLPGFRLYKIWQSVLNALKSY